ncbi:YwiC-like family protein [bacterium]|nr:YwiC-like family protein [bacterium]
MTNKPPTRFHKQVALPTDHGSWVFLLMPLLIGFFTAGTWHPAGLFLILAALMAFLIRQPTVMMTKAYSGRRSRNILPAARLWFIVYGFGALIALVQVIRMGYGFILWLGIPGILVFGWHLWLVSRREERHRIGVDIIASGSLAVAAPAAYWVSVGTPAPIGFWLWILVWLQSAASIVYAFLRLEQRKLKDQPNRAVMLKMGHRALLYSFFNLAVSAVLGAVGILPSFLWLPYALQFIEVLWGTFNPAVGVKPTHIGLRQLIISTLFTALFILAWNM